MRPQKAKSYSVYVSAIMLAVIMILIFQVANFRTNGLNSGIVKSNATQKTINENQNGINNPLIPRSAVGNRTLVVQLWDLENQIIPSAQVQLWDNANKTVNYTSTSNQYGNVTFANLYNTTWDLTANYSIGFNHANLTICYEQIPINLTAGGIKYNITQCNLTTVDFQLFDQAVLDPTEGYLYNANVSMVNTTSGAYITSYYSNYAGLIQLQIPAATFNFTVEYLGIARPFFFNVGTSFAISLTQNLTVQPATDYDLNVSIVETRSLLTIDSSTSYLQTNWTQQLTFDGLFYMDALYYGDQMNLIFDWSNYTDGSQIVNASNNWNIWTVSSGNVTLNSSSISPFAVNPVVGFTGQYNFIFNTWDYGSGTYNFVLQCNQTGFQPALFLMYIQVLNFTTTLTQLPNSEELNVNWNSTFSVSVNYTSILPMMENITQANLQYSIFNTSIQGQLSPIDPTMGIYTFNQWINASVGTYIITVWGNQTDFDFAAINITLIVNPLPTMNQAIINPSFSIGSELIVSQFENISFALNYSDINGLQIPSASISVFIDSILQPIQTMKLLSTSYWQFSTAAAPFALGLHTIQITTQAMNYAIATTTLTLEILDYWNTNINLTQAPAFYYWGDNASFIIQYYCTQAPRSNLGINQANIISLNLTTKANMMYYTQAFMNSSTLGTEWGWSDLSSILGAGFYQVWFKTHFLNVTQDTTFYAIPTLNRTIYRPMNDYNIYFQLSPVAMNLQLFNSSNTQNTITFLPILQNQAITIITQLNISQVSSILYQSPVDTASIQTTLTNITNGVDTVLGTQMIFSSGKGQYLYPINTATIGEYQIVFDATGSNFTESIATMTFNITRQVQFNITIPSQYRESLSTIQVANAENITFYVNVTDPDPQDVVVSVFFGSNVLPITWIYQLDTRNYLCTVPASTYGIGSYSVIIQAQLSNFVINSQTIQCNIIASWTSQTEITTLPENLPWGQNASVVIYYSCTDPIRLNQPIANASIAWLTVATATSSTSFGGDQIGQTWGFTDLSIYGTNETGYYNVWFNTSLYAVSSQTILYVIPFIGSDIYNQTSIIIPILVSPVATELTMNAASEPTNFNLLTLITQQNTSINVVYNVTDDLSSFYGQNLIDSSVTYQILTSGTVVGSGDLVLLGNGTFDLDISAQSYSVGIYTVQIMAQLENFTGQSISFSLFIGQNPTVFSYAIGSSFVVTNSLVKVALGENLSLIVTIPGADANTGNVTIMIGNTFMIGEYYIGNNQFLCTFPILGFNTTTYVLSIIAFEQNYVPSIVTLNIEIIQGWDTQVRVVEPPLIYPWGNIMSFNVSYSCIEYPRNGTLLANASINELDIQLITANGTQSVLNLNMADYGTSWGWSDLQQMGSGYYNIWFNTSYIAIENITSYYAVPYFVLTAYSNATTNPYFWIKLVPTVLTIVQSNYPINKLNEILAFLNQTVSISTQYNASDPTSVFYGAINTGNGQYVIYNNNSATVFSSGTLVYDSSQNTYVLNFPGITIGNYTIKFTLTDANFETSYAYINVIIQPHIMSFNFTNVDVQGSAQTPQNKDFVVVLTLVDNITGQPLSSGNVIATFMGHQYSFTEEASHPGIYALTIPSADFQSLTQELPYPMSVTFEAKNFTSVTFDVRLIVSYPVDPIFGVPYLYWIIIAVGIGIGIAILGAVRAVQISRIPVTIKNIMRMEKVISKSRALSGKSIAISRKVLIVERFAPDWRILGLDLNAILGLEKRTESVSLTQAIGPNDIKEESQAAEESPIMAEKPKDEMERLMEEVNKAKKEEPTDVLEKPKKSGKSSKKVVIGQPDDESSTNELDKMMEEINKAKKQNSEDDQ